jgi:hypothetical protein
LPSGPKNQRTNSGWRPISTQKQSLTAVFANEVRHAHSIVRHAASESVAIGFSHGLLQLCGKPNPGRVLNTHDDFET